MRRRIGIVILAILLAVIGTTAVLAYVRQADQRALAGQKGVSVLVATAQVPAGTPPAAARRLVRRASKATPAAPRPPDAVSSIGPGLGGLVFSTSAAPGQLLTRAMLVTSVQSASGMQIPAGMIAVTIQVCLPEAVAGNIRAGSQVAVFDTYAPGATTFTAQTDCTGPHQQQSYASVHTRLILPQVQVLSVGQASMGSSSVLGPGFGSSSAPSAISSQGTELITLAVSQADAERLIQISVAGVPYLALVTPSSGTAPDTKQIPLFNPVP